MGRKSWIIVIVGIVLVAAAIVFFTPLGIVPKLPTSPEKIGDTIPISSELTTQENSEVNRFKEILAEPQPEGDFCAIWAWRERLWHFLVYTGRPKGFDNIEDELERRSLALVKAIKDFLGTNKDQPLPECQGIDPMYAVSDLFEEDLLERTLLMRILKIHTKTRKDELQSSSQEEQKATHLSWRILATRFELNEAELKELGLSEEEIDNIL